MAFDCIVAGAYQRYDGVRSRLHHLVSRFSQHVPVLFVEETCYGSPERDVLSESDAVTVLRPVRRSFDTPAVDEVALATIRGWVGDRKPLVWLSTPAMPELAQTFGGATLVYDCARDLAALPYVSLDMRVKERALVERADLVLAASRTLYDMYARFGEQVQYAPSGVEFERFAAAPLEPQQLLRSLTWPIAGYFGTIDERIDFEIVRALAERGGNVVLVGPLARIDPAVLPRRANIHFTGQVDDAELPSLLAGFDVAIVPFAQAALRAGIVPQKIAEYAAGGKPIVTTPLTEVQGEWGDVVTFAETPEAFAAACEVAANQSDAARIATGVERAGALDWDALSSAIWSDVLALSQRG
jgi:glycosyltransferase involved in cell wall biosynthesis